MADTKSSNSNKSLLSSLTGHIAQWVTGNSGMSGQAGQALKSRQSQIDKQVDQATNPQPKQPANGKWPWQSK